MTHHEEKIIERLMMVLASESGDSIGDIALTILGMEFRDAQALLKDDIVTWQARNQFAEDYDNGLIF